jgi:hypothetical protein
MNQDEKLNRLSDALVANWALPENKQPSLHSFLEALAARVQELMDNDFDRLTTAMYTLDIDEDRFGGAMRLPDSKSKSIAVAALILERETQKVESRMQYDDMKSCEQNEKPIHPDLEGNRPTIESD